MWPFFSLYFLFLFFVLFPLPSQSKDYSLNLSSSGNLIYSSEFVIPDPNTSLFLDLYIFYLNSNFLDSLPSPFLLCDKLLFSYSEYIDTGVNLTDVLSWPLSSASDPTFSSNNLSWTNVDQELVFPSYVVSNFPSFDLTKSDVDFLMKQVPLSSDDFTESFRLIPSIPLSSVLPHNSWSISTLITSSFKGANLAANKNFSFYYDFGLTPKSTFSLFYSNAGDPLNPPLAVDTTPLWLSWELIGFSFKYSLFDYPSSSLTTSFSFESLGLSSIDFDDQFGFGQASYSFDNYSIGSFSSVYTWSLEDSLHFTVSPGINLLPSTLRHEAQNTSSFFGITPYIASGVNWQPSIYFDLFASLSIPLGIGSNVVTSDLEFLRSPIISFGANLKLNPRSYISASLSNGFGSTPATNLLTTPMQESFNYNLSFSFFPDLLDSPLLPFSDRQLSLANSRLFVSSAVLPPENYFTISLGSTMNRNLFTSVGYSLSNQVFFRFDNLWIEQSGFLSSDVSTAFFEDGSIGSTVSASFNFLSPLRGSSFWSSATLAFGSNSYISDISPLGFSFLSFDNTFEFSNDVALNLNPKFLISGFGLLSGVGISANFPFCGEFEFIPGINLVYNNSDFNQSNVFASVHWRISDSRSLELYVSNARSPIDVGQMQRSDFFSLGFNTRFYF